MKVRVGVTMIAVVAALASCTRVSDDLSGPPSETPSSASPTATGPAADARIFYVLEQADRFFLVPEMRRVVEASPGVGRMGELLAGEPHDPDLSSPWPSAARVLGVTIEHGIAIVDLSAEALIASGGGELERAGLQAAVHTLSDVPGVERVQFSIEGKTSGEASNGRAIEDWWGHVGLSEQPFAADDELLAPITIDSPEEGATVSRTFTVSGEATVFEANVILRVRDVSGRVVRSGFTTASIGAPDRGTWEAELTLPSAPGEYTIEAVEEDQERGGDRFVMTRVVRLA